MGSTAGTWTRALWCEVLLCWLVLSMMHWMPAAQGLACCWGVVLDRAVAEAWEQCGKDPGLVRTFRAPGITCPRWWQTRTALPPSPSISFYSFEHSSWFLWAILCLLVNMGVSAAFYSLSPTDLESTIFPRNPGSFWWKQYLDTTIYMSGVVFTIVCQCH